MLKKIPKNLSPQLVKVLMEMGHGDELVLADGNYPAASNAQRLIRCDGLMIPELLTSILELFPLDQYVERPVALMKVAEGDVTVPTIWQDYQHILTEYSPGYEFEMMERSAFYERGKQAYAIIATGEEALYGNLLLKKGVVRN